MSDDDFGHSETDTEFGRELIASLQEALAHKRARSSCPRATMAGGPPYNLNLRPRLT